MKEIEIPLVHVPTPVIPQKNEKKRSKELKNMPSLQSSQSTLQGKASSGGLSPKLSCKMLMLCTSLYEMLRLFVPSNVSQHAALSPTTLKPGTPLAPTANGKHETRMYLVQFIDVVF